MKTSVKKFLEQFWEDWKQYGHENLRETSLGQLVN